jgi:Zn-dependent peptidase ImmA (M78 family)
VTPWRLTQPPDDNEQLAAVARQTLLSASPLALPQGRGTVYDHLNVWVAGLETAGDVVLATAGGRVPTTEMRAFSLYFDVMPVIVVNGADAARGRMFSLLHEYARLLLHSDGLCDLVTPRATTPNARLEARCNAIAAAILMPRDLVLAHPAVRARASTPASWDYAALADAAGRGHR